MADSINEKFTFSYDELKTHVSDKDTLLLKAIIDSGEREVVSPDVIKNLLLPYKVRILTRKGFSEVEMPAMKFNRKELQVAGKIDSLERYINLHSPDSSEFRHLYSMETKLIKSKVFKSYIRKTERARKRLMFFCPFIRFRNHILMAMIYYNSLTNSAEKIRIFDTLQFK